MSIYTTDIDLLDHTDDPDNVLPTTGMNTPSDITSSTDHIISTQPISTDHDDTTMSTTNNILIDVTQTDNADTGETTELVDLLKTTAMDEIKATTQPISTDHEDTMSTTNGILIDATQTDGTDTEEATELVDMLNTATMDEVKTTAAITGSDITQPELPATENLNDFSADGEGLLGADSGEDMATAGAMIISPIIDLIIALAFVMLMIHVDM